MYVYVTDTGAVVRQPAWDTDSDLRKNNIHTYIHTYVCVYTHIPMCCVIYGAMVLQPAWDTDSDLRKNNIYMYTCM